MDYSSILMIVVMIAVFYFLLIRPENQRKKKAEEMRNSIRKGERITTIGGLVGLRGLAGTERTALDTAGSGFRTHGGLQRGCG